MHPKVIRMSPLLLSPGSRRITVFGGGNVALRKCRHFEGFRIRIVSEDLLEELDGIVDEAIRSRIDPDDLERYIEDADIVIAATDDRDLNDRIRDISMSRGIMTNSAHGGGDLLIPSVLRRDGYVVAVSSEGRVPAFPPYVIERLDEFLDESYDDLLELLLMLRPCIRNRIPTTKGRTEFLNRIIRNETIREILATDGVDSAFRESVRIGGLE